MEATEVSEHTIIVGHDGSDRGSDALALGGLLARHASCPLVLVPRAVAERHEHAGVDVEPAETTA